MKTLIAALIALFLAAPALAGPEEDAVRDTGRQWLSHFKAGDLESLMSLYADNPQVALHGQPKLSGREAVRAYFAPRLKSGPGGTKPDTDFLLLEESIEVRGNTAIAISKYWLTLRTGGNEYKDAGRSLLVYTKGQDGQWRIAHDIDQATPDVTFPAPPEAQ
jgi:uncharacterized protein (TIGR02246 family)